MATSPDVAEAVRLVESAYSGDTSRAGWTTEADLLDGQRTGSQDFGRRGGSTHSGPRR